MKKITSIIIFLSVFAFFFIAKEFAEIYFFLSTINIYLGYSFLGFISLFTTIFLVIPTVKLVAIPPRFTPVRKEEKVQKSLESRIRFYSQHPLIKHKEIPKTLSNENKLREINRYLEREAKDITRKHISRLFYYTAVSQNGFIDAILMWSISIRLINELFKMYQGRTSLRHLLIIGKNLYFSIIISGIEGVEYATEEILQKLAGESLKSVPFLDKVIASVADGFVNASLLTRISLITQNYCEMVYLEDKKNLYPPTKIVFETTKLLTYDIIDSFRKQTSNTSYLKKIGTTLFKKK